MAEHATSWTRRPDHFDVSRRVAAPQRHASAGVLPSTLQDLPLPCVRSYSCRTFEREFPKILGAVWEVPAIRISVFWGLCSFIFVYGTFQTLHQRHCNWA